MGGAAAKDEEEVRFARANFVYGEKARRLTRNTNEWLLSVDPRVAPNGLEVGDGFDRLEISRWERDSFKRFSVESESKVRSEDCVVWRRGHRCREGERREGCGWWREGEVAKREED